MMTKAFEKQDNEASGHCPARTNRKPAQTQLRPIQQLKHALASTSNRDQPNDPLISHFLNTKQSLIAQATGSGAGQRRF